MTHVLVTNDFPPKVGGIQSYLYELWRRLDADSFAVLTHDEEGAGAFDAAQPFRVERLPSRMLVPSAALARRVETLAREVRAGLVVLDPALPLGLLGRHLSTPYAVLLHGAEVTVPARLPLARHALRDVIDRASLLVAAGGYPAREAAAVARRPPPTVVVPPGVDSRRFIPPGPAGRQAARDRFEIPVGALVVASVSRLVPRKGMDVLIEASAELASDHPELLVLIAGTGRDAPRLERLAARLRAPVRFLGRVEDDELPSLLAASDLFAMLCRNRWLGLEQEGFGIVFLEAVGCGLAVLAGRSGGSGEAVLHERTGLVLDRPGDLVVAKAALGRLIDDGALRLQLGAAGRRRMVEEFDYDGLARRLGDALRSAGG